MYFYSAIKKKKASNPYTLAWTVTVANLAITVDTANNVYIGEYTSKKYNTNGTQLYSQYGYYGNFTNGIKVDASQYFYYCENGYSYGAKQSVNLVTELVQYSTKVTPFLNPIVIGLDFSNNVWIADDAHQIQKFNNTTGARISYIPSITIAITSFDFDNFGAIYACGNGSPSVKKVDTTTGIVAWTYVLPSGNASSIKVNPATGESYTSNGIYLTKLDINGALIWQVTTANSINKMCIDANFNIYTVDGGKYIKKYDTNGVFISSYLLPLVARDIAIDSENSLLIAATTAIYKIKQATI
jgi:hypothetical protein